jgi:hypothetical protein
MQQDPGLHRATGDPGTTAEAQQMLEERYEVADGIDDFVKQYIPNW